MVLGPIRTAILLTPGPTFVHPEILRKSARKMISHRSATFRELFSSILERLKKTLFTSQHVAILTGSCTLAIEATIWSLFRPGDEVLVLNFGEFGRRLVESARRRGLNVKELKFDLGTAPEPDAIVEEARGKKAVISVVTETSTGAKIRDLKEFVRAIKDSGAMVVLDASSAYAGEVIKCDEWEIDALMACSQKALGSTPGVSFVMLSEEAKENLTQEGVPMYLDLARYLKFHEERMETPFTPAISVLYALDAALDMLLEEGVERRANRLRELRDYFYSKAEERGFPAFPKREYWANTVAAIRVRGASSIKSSLEKRGIFVASGIGSLKDEILRIGIMGWVSRSDLDKLLKVLSSMASA